MAWRNERSDTNHTRVTEAKIGKCMQGAQEHEIEFFIFVGELTTT